MGEEVNCNQCERQAKCRETENTTGMPVCCGYVPAENRTNGDWFSSLSNEKKAELIIYKGFTTKWQWLVWFNEIHRETDDDL